MNNETVVFFGAGPVAAKSLELLNKHFKIEAVITKGPANKKIKDYPVIAVAEDLKLNILYANNKNEVDGVCKETFKSELGVLIDFGVIVSDETIKSFPRGIVNSHFSLLPEWRGADPITYSLLSGQKYTGVTLMLLSSGMDEGPIIGQEKLLIESEDTGISLTEKLISLSNEMLKNLLPKYINNSIQPVDQIEYAKINNHNLEPTYSKKINKQDGKINWTKSAQEIEREIRAYQPWPKSYTKIGDDLIITIIKAKISTAVELKPGEIHTTKNELFIGTKDGCIELLEVQPAGKNKMTVNDFLRGYLNKLFVQIT